MPFAHPYLPRICFLFAVFELSKQIKALREQVDPPAASDANGFNSCLVAWRKISTGQLDEPRSARYLGHA